MCNCKDLPSAIGPVCDVSRDQLYRGANYFKEYFEDLICYETMVPPVEFGGKVARCKECNQHWYIEREPEEELITAFALKLSSSIVPSVDQINAQQSFLLILAHHGFSDESCQQQACCNQALNGRALCHVHWGFPSHS
jgi:hypothetical protein